ncbi:hypothetical protein PanWU01x14_033360 [Parasponia andersonii]|uniref:Uncharacterized protein n=1 Tax=Parasponia andersonii TaxID=3476 RepID=A0A2P5DTN2_PARAD|nr:hypothetical protein PanWU01x14_033360 [Parasponia andersonii]
MNQIVNESSFSSAILFDKSLFFSNVVAANDLGYDYLVVAMVVVDLKMERHGKRKKRRLEIVKL